MNPQCSSFSLIVASNSANLTTSALEYYQSTLFPHETKIIPITNNTTEQNIIFKAFLRFTPHANSIRKIEFEI